MHARRLVALFLCALPLQACVFNHGPRARSMPGVRNATGAIARANVGSGIVAGELIEVRDSSIVVIWAQRVGELEFADITRISVAGRSFDVRDGAVSPDGRERLRLLSRHPAGIPPAALQALLARHNQNELVPVTGAAPRREEDEEVAGFIAAARAGTEMYHDRVRAIADGYRRIGPDSPGMGEHWINPGLVTLGVLDAARPQILSYVHVDGRPRLIGVAYALALRAGEVPPVSPIPCEAWHAHTGTIAAEAMSLHSAALNGVAAHATECGGDTHAHTHHDGGSAPVRLATVHAWVWLDNPDGVFAPDNWAVPYVRLGIDPGPDASASAGRALALAAGDAAYFAGLLQYHAELTAAEADRAEATLTAAGRRIMKLLQRDRADMAAGAAEWDRAWLQIERSVADERRSSVRRVRLAVGG